MFEQLKAIRRQELREQIRQAERDAAKLARLSDRDAELLATFGEDARAEAYAARQQIGMMKVALTSLGG